ncbi:MAG TPA: signal peptidase I [Phycisphaerae bacterium]|nr:signal peptidase I [Phycisphaerae bacterium]
MKAKDGRASTDRRVKHRQVRAQAQQLHPARRGSLQQEDMMDGVLFANAAAAGTPYRGWFVGHFVRGLGQTSDVEIKWGVHPKGQQNGSFATNARAHSLSVLVSGRFRIIFESGGEREEVMLEKAGDFALWKPGVPHDWVAEEDSVVLTVRWPSIPRDQGA